MKKVKKIFQEVTNISKSSNIKFLEFQKLLEELGFSSRIKGDQFIYYKDGIDEIINIQPDGNSAKPYQVKQVRNIIWRCSDA